MKKSDHFGVLEYSISIIAVAILMTGIAFIA